MTTRNLLRHIFRHGTRQSADANTPPLEPKPHAPAPTTTPQRDPPTHNTAPSTLPPPPQTPEPFGLEDILEEPTRPSTPSVTASETLAWFAQEILTFSTRELIDATLYEAKSAASSHLDTIATALSVLEALEGFSATIAEVRGEMLEKKRVCEEQVATLDAVGRCVEGMRFAGDMQEDGE